MGKKRWISWAAAALLLVAPATASAQERLAVRAMAATTTTGSGFTHTPLVGAGIGVDVGEFFEVVAEGAIAPAVDYPPPKITPTGPAGPPYTLVIVLIEERRVDRYLLGGVRLLTPTETVRPFGELTVGWNREVAVDRNPFTDVPESVVSTGTFVSLGGGLELRLRSRFDVFAGYRYARDPSGEFAFQGFHAGVGFGLR